MMKIDQKTDKRQDAAQEYDAQIAEKLGEFSTEEGRSEFLLHAAYFREQLVKQQAQQESESTVQEEREWFQKRSEEAYQEMAETPNALEAIRQSTLTTLLNAPNLSDEEKWTQQEALNQSTAKAYVESFISGSAGERLTFVHRYQGVLKDVFGQYNNNALPAIVTTKEQEQLEAAQLKPNEIAWVGEIAQGDAFLQRGLEGLLTIGRSGLDEQVADFFDEAAPNVLREKLNGVKKELQQARLRYGEDLYSVLMAFYGGEQVADYVRQGRPLKDSEGNDFFRYVIATNGFCDEDVEVRFREVLPPDWERLDQKTQQVLGRNLEAMLKADQLQSQQSIQSSYREAMTLLEQGDELPVEVQKVFSLKSLQHGFGAQAGKQKYEDLQQLQVQVKEQQKLFRAPLALLKKQVENGGADRDDVKAKAAKALLEAQRADPVYYHSKGNYAVDLLNVKIVQLQEQLEAAEDEAEQSTGKQMLQQLVEQKNDFMLALQREFLGQTEPRMSDLRVISNSQAKALAAQLMEAKEPEKLNALMAQFDEAYGDYATNAYLELFSDGGLPKGLMLLPQIAQRHLNEVLKAAHTKSVEMYWELDKKGADLEVAVTEQVQRDLQTANPESDIENSRIDALRELLFNMAGLQMIEHEMDAKSAVGTAYAKVTGEEISYQTLRLNKSILRWDGVNWLGDKAQPMRSDMDRAGLVYEAVMQFLLRKMDAENAGKGFDIHVGKRTDHVVSQEHFLYATPDGKGAELFAEGDDGARRVVRREDGSPIGCRFDEVMRREPRAI